jgi:hypothetical protein
MPVTFDITTRRGRERMREVWTGCKVSSLSEDDFARAGAAGYEPGPDGYLVGIDPRRMTQAELQAMGHEPMSPMDAIRAKCLDCCAGSSDEVRKCVAMACPSWPFRTGKNPWRTISEAQREIGRRLAAQRLGKSSGAKQGLDEDAGTALPATIPQAEALRSPGAKQGLDEDAPAYPITPGQGKDTGGAATAHRNAPSAKHRLDENAEDDPGRISLPAEALRSPELSTGLAAPAAPRLVRRAPPC